MRIRRALGFTPDRAERLLGQLVAYLHDHDVEVPTIEDALAWAILPADATPRWWAHRLGTVRAFATHLHTLHAHVEAHRLDSCPARHGGPPRYLYSPADITASIGAASTLPRPAGSRDLPDPDRAAGRERDARRRGDRLDRDDLDADHDGLLRVRHGKFGKSRLIPLHPSTIAALQGDLRLRDDLLPAPASPALLVSTIGTRLRDNNSWRTFHRLLCRAGITARSASCQPRTHDLRHSLAVQTMLDWSASGAGVPALLPRLSTYSLGHTDPKHTYWSLQAAPELLALAAHRLDAYQTGQGRQAGPP